MAFPLVARFLLNYKPYSYTPNMGGNAFFLAIFAIAGFLYLWQMVSKKTWVFSSLMMIGAFVEMGGYGGRVASAVDVYVLEGFLAQTVLCIVAPCFFSAALYLTLGKFVHIFGRQYSLLSARNYGIIFIGCDIFSLTLQAIGGGIAATAQKKKTSPATGTHIMIAGIDFQMASITLFVVLACLFARNFRRAAVPIDRNVKKFIMAVVVALILLYIRAIYRTVELAEGWTGYLITHEPYFLVLDSTTMFLVAALFIVFAPGRLLPRTSSSLASDPLDKEKQSSSQRLDQSP